MPPTEAKRAAVALLADLMRPAQCLIVADHRGLKTPEMNELRRELRGTDAIYRVVKNTFMRLAAKQVGAEELERLLRGPSSVAFCNDDVAKSVRVLRDFMRSNPTFTVRGGLLGRQLLNADEVMALANLPGREQLQAGLVGSLQGPLAQVVGLLGAHGPLGMFVGALDAVAGSLVRVLEARREQLESADAA